MAAPKGHPRYGGRRKGSLNKRTTNFQADIAESGLTPMRYLQGVMCDEKADPDRRDRAAIAMMPYLVPRLAVVDVNAKVKTEDTSQLTMRSAAQKHAR